MPYMPVTGEKMKRLAQRAIERGVAPAQLWRESGRGDRESGSDALSSRFVIQVRWCAVV